MAKHPSSQLLFEPQSAVQCSTFLIFNRPGVTGAVLQKPLSLIGSVSDPFPHNLQKISLKNRKSLGANILIECSPTTMSHMSHVTCHVSCDKASFSVSYDLFLTRRYTAYCVGKILPRHQRHRRCRKTKKTNYFTKLSF